MRALLEKAIAIGLTLLTLDKCEERKRLERYEKLYQYCVENPDLPDCDWLKDFEKFKER